MIFVGDIALPHKGAITYKNFPPEFYQKQWFGNLEGPIVNQDDNAISAVYNHQEAIDELRQTFDFKGFGLANNHIFDTGSYQDTLNYLKSHNFLFTGMGSSLNEANQEVIIEISGKKIVIVNFGWEVIQCEITTGDYLGVNPLRKSHVLTTVKNLLDKYPGAVIIPFMHWSYELEAEPQPFERQLAQKLIDMGVAGVIGCHPHRIGGIEFYKGKPLIFSLGNWLFKQHHFFQGKLKFPDFCNMQLAFEWDFEKGEMLFHFFEFNKTSSELVYVKTEDYKTDCGLIDKYTPFRGLTDAEYKKWYKQNHYHKNKGLPVFYWEDSQATISLKRNLIKLRDKALKLVLRKGK